MWSEIWQVDEQRPGNVSYAIMLHWGWRVGMIHYVPNEQWLIWLSIIFAVKIFSKYSAGCLWSWLKSNMTFNHSTHPSTCNPCYPTIKLCNLYISSVPSDQSLVSIWNYHFGSCNNSMTVVLREVVWMKDVWSETRWGDYILISSEMKWLICEFPHSYFAQLKLYLQLNLLWNCNICGM